MSYHKKIEKFFKDKGLTQVEISRRIPYTQVMISRYLTQNKPNYEFILSVTKAFPDIDWNYLFKEDENMVNEEGESYEKTPKILLKEIEVRVELLKKWHDSDTKQK